jgi:hypothetical protein
MSRYEILTTEGFKEYDSVIRHLKKGIMVIKTSKSFVRCTCDHLIETQDGFVSADELIEGDLIRTENGFDEVIDIEIDIDSENYVYDVVNVKDTHSFLANGLSVHNCLYWDEASFCQHGVAEKFIESVMPAIYRGKTTQVLITSTPNGLDHFYDIWKKAEQGKSDYHPIFVAWNEIPDRDEAFKNKMITDYGIKFWNQEFACQFIGSSSTLIKPEVLETMVYEDPIDMKWKDKLMVYEYPQKYTKEQKTIYVIGVDTAMGVGKDSSVAQVVKVSWDDASQKMKYQQVAVFKDEYTSPADYAEIVLELAKWYHNAVLMIENNDVGGNVATLLWYKYEYENILNLDKGIGIRSNNRLKVEACLHMKEIVEGGMQIIHKDTIHEFGVFEERRSNVFQAQNGKHDDCLMALMWALYLTKTTEFEDYGFAIPELAGGESKYKIDEYNDETDSFF